jgi:uncharacterized protein (TIGR00661 family)
MKIVYGIHGYGRGHASRALAILPELSKRHEIQILAGGDAYDLLSPEYPVQRIPTLCYYYGKRMQRSTYQTTIRNMPVVMDILLVGPAFESVCSAVRDFAPDVVLSDADVYTHRAAARLGIPRIGFDHYGILVHCRPESHWTDRFNIFLESFSYRRMIGQADRVIVSSFYSAPPLYDGVAVVPPILRAEVRQTEATDGDHLLVYLNKGPHQFTPKVERTLRSYDGPVRIYGVDHRPRTDGNLTFRPPSNLPFVEDLASCRAVVSTAGNQLVGETVYFGKPMLVIPERTVEQRLNAYALGRLGIGMRVPLWRIRPEVLQAFLEREDEYRANVARLVQDGLGESLRMIENYIHELSGQPEPRPDRLPKAETA